jgi:acyl-CoA thioester hydrolase
VTSWRGRSGEQRTIPDHCATLTLHRVCVGETDMMGIVHHANYVAYFERGRLEYMRHRGLPYKEMVDRGYQMPVVELNLRYRRPAQFDDVLQVETRLGALSRVTVRFNYTISRPKPASPGEPPDLLLEGHVLLACIDEKNRPRPLPQDVVRTLFLPEIEQADEGDEAPVLTPGSRVG